MTRRKFPAMVGALIAVGIVAAFLGAPAASAAAPIPDDVVAAFSVEALPLVKEELNAATGFGTIHQINVWSDALRHGDTGDAPIVAIDEWIAPITNDAGAAIGVYRVWRDSPGALARYAGYDIDAALGASMSNMSADLDLVNEPETASWYSFDGSFVRPLNEQGQAQFSDPTQIDDVASALAARTAQTDLDEHNVVFNGWLMGGIGLAILACVGVLAYVQARGRRT